MINLGEAAHITAAAPGGPRYDPNLTPEERRGLGNGLWLCAIHAKEVDSDKTEFTVEGLRDWKAKAEANAFEALTTGRLVLPEGFVAVEIEVLERLGIKDVDVEKLTQAANAAARADIAAFKALASWPVHAVALNLQVAGSSASAFDATACASAIQATREITVVAPPGTGKSTTCVQLVEALLDKGVVAVLIPLNEWSTQPHGFMGSLIHRMPYRGFREVDFQALALHGRLALVLDGWNELDPASRRKASAEITRLQRESSDLQLVVSTRRQVLDVPLTGPTIEIQPLSQEQQMEIVRAIRGAVGERLLEAAWRQPGVRELVSIPFFLTALLQAPQGKMPDTKEEVLRLFIAAHERVPRNAVALNDGFYGLHAEVLRALAVEATAAGNTAISEARSRSVVAQVEDKLNSGGQLTERPQPAVILDLLVNHHTLIRIGAAGGVSFQHEQIQEWYASFEVEQLMRDSAAGNKEARARLSRDVLNWPIWEEPILFACERISRADDAGVAAAAIAITDALAIDPMLAAEMIFRSSDAVWRRVGATVQERMRRWHAPGKIDRALRFMIASGRPEFLDQVWPLITHENNQVSLSALRAATRVRPSILGRDAAKRIAALSPNVRKTLLHEIALNSGIDGLDLATAVASNDPSPEVKATVVDALSFRRADRHVAEVLSGGADEETFDLVARRNLLDAVADDNVKKRLDAARKRLKETASSYERLRAIVYGPSGDDRSGELSSLIAEMEIEKRDDAKVGLIYDGLNRYSRAIADGLLRRVRADVALFYGTDDILAGAGLSLEDDDLVEIALADSRQYDTRAHAAASVLGPRAVQRLVEALHEVRKRLSATDRAQAQAASKRHSELEGRIEHASGTSLIAAVSALSGQADNEEIAELSHLISRHPRNDETTRARPFGADSLATIRELVEEWGNRLLASEAATRQQLASIATLASHAPASSLLPMIKRLLDEELRRRRVFRQQAIADQWRGGTATHEARMSWTHQYQQAFKAIGGPETAAIMREYLADKDFGESAAVVLAAQWRAANELSRKGWFRPVDFSRVDQRRTMRAAFPEASSAEADSIFEVVERLLADGTEESRKHGLALGIIAAQLPHGARDATIEKLVSIAPRRSRAALLQNLALSGEPVDIDLVKRGIAEVLEAAKTSRWILTDGYELKEWLRLLPFTTRPTDAAAIVQGLPEEQRRPHFLEEMRIAFGETSSSDAEHALFQLAESDPRLYADHAWREAVIRRNTVSSARRLVDLAANGTFEGKGMDRWRIARGIGDLISEHPEVRAYVYDLLRSGSASRGHALLAQAIEERPDADGLLLLVELDIKQKRSSISGLTVEKVVTEHVPAENWKDAYHVVPAPAADLRRKLLSMTTNGGPMDAAARCLNAIDKIRDRYGLPEAEPRHPDLASGREWPVIVLDPDASETG